MLSTVRGIMRYGSRFRAMVFGVRALSYVVRVGIRIRVYGLGETVAS